VLGLPRLQVARKSISAGGKGGPAADGAQSVNQKRIESMNLSIQFQYTFEEFAEGTAAISANAARKARAGQGILGWVLFVGLAIVIFFMLQSGKNSPLVQPSTNSNDSRKYYPLIIFAFLITIGALSYFGRKKRARKAFEQRMEFQRLETVQFSDDAIVRDDHVSQSRIAWDGFVKFDETTHLFLLYLSDASALMIPKRAFPSPAVVDEFRTFAKARISPPRFAFPVLPPHN
jgi:hypothetical protein